MPSSGPIRSQIGPALFHLKAHTHTAQEQLALKFDRRVVTFLKAERAQVKRAIERLDALNQEWRNFMESLDCEALGQEEKIYDEFPPRNEAEPENWKHFMAIVEDARDLLGVIDTSIEDYTESQSSQDSREGSGIHTARSSPVLEEKGQPGSGKDPEVTGTSAFHCGVPRMGTMPIGFVCANANPNNPYGGMDQSGFYYQQPFSHPEYMPKAKSEFGMMPEPKEMQNQQFNDIRLPRIEMPFFRGEIKEWPLFWQMFEASVDSKPIAPIMKMIYLMNYLKGQAAQVAAGFIPSNENYPILLSLLKSRFGKSQALAEQLQADLINMPKPNESLGIPCANSVKIWKEFAANSMAPPWKKTGF